VDERTRQLQELMAARDLGALLLRLPENVLLCSRTFPRSGFSFVLVPRAGEPWLVAPEGEEDDPLGGTLRVERFGWCRLQDGDPYPNVARVLGALKGSGSGTTTARRSSPPARPRSSSPGWCSPASRACTSRARAGSGRS
jgi:hypothetical protein